MWLADFAQAAGLPVGTVRFYMCGGLLDPTPGRAGGAAHRSRGVLCADHVNARTSLPDCLKVVAQPQPQPQPVGPLGIDLGLDRVDAP